MKRFAMYLAAIVMMSVASVPFVPTTTVNAVVGSSCPNQNPFFPSWYDNMCDGNGNIVSPNAEGGSDAKNTGERLGAWLTQIAINLVTMLLTLVAYVSLVFVIYGGFKYMTSGDNSSGTQAARKTITNALIGLVISILSVAIVRFVSGVIE